MSVLVHSDVDVLEPAQDEDDIFYDIYLFLFY